MMTVMVEIETYMLKSSRECDRKIEEGNISKKMAVLEGHGRTNDLGCNNKEQEGHLFYFQALWNISYWEKTGHLLRLRKK
jgi:hypothetical protein